MGYYTELILDCITLCHEQDGFFFKVKGKLKARIKSFDRHSGELLNEFDITSEGYGVSESEIYKEVIKNFIKGEVRGKTLGERWISKERGINAITIDIPQPFKDVFNELLLEYNTTVKKIQQ